MNKAFLCLMLDIIRAREFVIRHHYHYQLELKAFIEDYEQTFFL